MSVQEVVTHAVCPRSNRILYVLSIQEVVTHIYSSISYKIQGVPHLYCIILYNRYSRLSISYFKEGKALVKQKVAELARMLEDENSSVAPSIFQNKVCTNILTRLGKY